MRTNSNNIHGVLAEFKNPKELIDAAESVKESGYSDFDTYAPFPIHGMEKAMGLKQSPLGWFVVAGGLIGGIGILWLMIWVMTNPDVWALNISGKPYLNIPIYVPITFEITVLLSSFAALGGMLFLNNLPKLHNPLFNAERFEKAMDDGFFICIEASDKLFSEQEASKLFTDAGAIHVETVYDSE